jgi:hypothetical protein
MNMFLHLGNHQSLMLRDMLVILNNSLDLHREMKSLIITADQKWHYSPISSRTLKKRIDSISFEIHQGSGGEII